MLQTEKLAIWTRREACCLPVLQSWKKAYCCRARMLCQLPRLLARPLYNQAVSGQMGLFHTSSSLSKWVLIRWLFCIIFTSVWICDIYSDPDPRIRSSVPLTNVSGSGSWAVFVSDLQDGTKISVADPEPDPQHWFIPYMPQQKTKRCLFINL